MSKPIRAARPEGLGPRRTTKDALTSRPNRACATHAGLTCDARDAQAPARATAQRIGFVAACAASPASTATRASVARGAWRAGSGRALCTHGHDVEQATAIDERRHDGARRVDARVRRTCVAWRGRHGRVTADEKDESEKSHAEAWHVEWSRWQDSNLRLSNARYQRPGRANVALSTELHREDRRREQLAHARTWASSGACNMQAVGTTGLEPVPVKTSF